MRNIFAALACFFAIGAAPPSPASYDAAVTSAARAVLAKGDAKSLSVAVVRDGKIVYAKAFGNATPDTEYYIGSSTKTFTAVSIMQLIEARKLSLDDHLAKFFGSFPNADHITIQHLLTHTSGLQDYLDNGIRTGAAAKPITPDQIVTQGALMPLQFQPGTAWGYSNLNYVLLARIVEQISGTSLARYEQEHIFGPAGMRATAMARPVLPQNAAIGFETPTSELAHAGAVDPSWYYAVGDIVSTASDLARFDIALMNGKLVSPATFQRMMQAAPFESTIASHWRDGLGLFLAPYGGQTLVGHHGGEPGFRADNEMVPERALAVAILGNGSYNTDALLRPVLVATFPEIVAYERAHPQTPAADPEPEITARSRAFITGFMRGEVNAAELIPEMNAVLTPAALAAAKTQFAARGTLSSLTFLSKMYADGYRIYSYKAVFTTGEPQYPRVVYSKDGKFAGLQNLNP